MAPCFEQLYDLEGSEEAVLSLNVPVLFWDGKDDAYHDPMQKYANSNGFSFVSTSGDHLLAKINSAGVITREIKRFLQA